MDGARVCLGPAVSFADESDMSSCPEVGKSVLDLLGSQSKPGLTIKFMVSPSFTSYSFRSFASTRAFPLRSKRCASTGGACGCDASCDLISEMVSVDCTSSVKAHGGLRDLNVMWMVATFRHELSKYRSKHACASDIPDAADDAGLRSGRGGTGI